MVDDANSRRVPYSYALNPNNSLLFSGLNTKKSKQGGLKG